MACIHVKFEKFKRGRSPSLHLAKEGDFARRPFCPSTYSNLGWNFEHDEIQSNLSYVTLQGWDEIRLHKTGVAEYRLNLNKYHCIRVWKSWSLNTGSLYIEVVAKTGLTVFPFFNGLKLFIWCITFCHCTLLTLCWLNNSFSLENSIQFTLFNEKMISRR